MSSSLGGQWLLAYRFADLDSALNSYTTACEIVLQHRITASVCRLLLDSGARYMVVLGEGRTPRILGNALPKKSLTDDLPPDVIRDLVASREAGRSGPLTPW